MASSYLDYRGKSARLNDQMLTALVLIATEVAREMQLSSTACRLITEWKDSGICSGPGLIEINLSGFWETEQGVRELRDLLSSIRKKIAAYGEVIPGDVFNRLINTEEMSFVDTDVGVILEQLDRWTGLAD